MLSFPFHSKKELKKKLRKDKEIYLGDIIINLNKVASKNDSKNFISQFDQLWIHGLVHLFGHDHKKYKDYKKMHQVENFFFNLVND